MTNRAGLWAVVAGLILVATVPVHAEEVVLSEPVVVGAQPLPVGPIPVIEELPCPFFAEVDYLHWWVRAAPVPVPLVAGPNAPLDLLGAGANRGNPAFRTLFGNQALDPGPYSGLRVRLGLAPTDSGEPGVELSGLLLPRTSAGQSFTTPDGNPNGLIVPFRDTSRVPASEGGQAIAGNLGGRFVPGSVVVANATEAWGADIAASMRLFSSEELRFDLRGGFRHFFFADTLTLVTQSSNGAESFSTFDRFLTRNYFFGPQGGARVSWQAERFEARARLDLALGVMGESLRVSGATVRPASAVRARPGPVQVNGGLLSVPSLGITREARFTALPELGLDLAFHLSDVISLRVGYNVLYLSSARRAGDQVLRSLNPRTLPVNGGDFNALPTPNPIFRHTDVTLHGLHFGIEARF